MEKLLEIESWAQYLLLIPLGAVLVAAAITDLRSRKIYNSMTYPAFVIGLLLHAIAFGFGGLLAGFLTALVVIIVGLLILPFGWLGGGDIKLLAVIGATLGPGPLFEIFFYSVCVGFVMGVSISLINGYLWSVLKRIGRFFRSILLTVTTQTNMTQKLETDERGYLPFAIPILFGAVFATTDVFLGWPLFMDWLRESMQSIRFF